MLLSHLFSLLSVFLNWFLLFSGFSALSCSFARFLSLHVSLCPLQGVVSVLCIDFSFPRNEFSMSRNFITARWGTGNEGRRGEREGKKEATRGQNAILGKASGQQCDSSDTHTHAAEGLPSLEVSLSLQCSGLCFRNWCLLCEWIGDLLCVCVCVCPRVTHQ